MPEQDKYLNTYREFKEQNTQYNQEISNHSDSD